MISNKTLFLVGFLVLAGCGKAPTQPKTYAMEFSIQGTGSVFIQDVNVNGNSLAYYQAVNLPWSGGPVTTTSGHWGMCVANNTGASNVYMTVKNNNTTLISRPVTFSYTTSECADGSVQ